MEGLAGDLAYGIVNLRGRVERKRVEDALRRSDERKSVLNRIADIVLTTPDEEMFAEVLDVVLSVTRSPFGLFGYLSEDGALVLPSMTRGIWDRCGVDGKSFVFPPATWGASLWGRSIREGRVLRSVGPFGTPPGHVQVDTFMSVPILFGGATIGLISLANKEGGYSGEDEELSAQITAFLAPILNARLQRDRQERRRGEVDEALRRSEQKYRLLVAHASEGILIAKDGAIQYQNPKAEEMLGRTGSELAGIRFVDLVHPDDRRFVVELGFEGGAARTQPETEPFKMLDAEGRVLWVRLTCTAIPWEGSEGLLCFLRNVTEEVALEAQVQQAQRLEAVGRFAGGVAHDFNNVLLVINGYTDMALSSLHERDPVRRDLLEVKEAGQRAAALTRQFLALSRRQVLAVEVLDVNALIARVENMLRRLIGEDVELATVLAPDLWRIKADPGQLEQIILNLAANARDALPGGGRFMIETANVTLDDRQGGNRYGEAVGPQVMLTASDNGCGMDAQTMSRVFEPFFTTKEKGKGTGLGLAIVYGIVKQSGGSIRVQSEPGKGTTFNILFPRAEGEMISARPPPSEGARGEGETVLVVEDEDAARGLVVLFLRRGGYNVIPANSAGEALLLAEQHVGEIDVLLADVVLPHMDGRELAQRLRATNPELQVVLMSGYTGDVAGLDRLLEDSDRFIQKPFSAEALLARIRSALTHRR
jgi:two-component system, cell cycle sensor histidine kinase and response regulator CckA